MVTVTNGKGFWTGNEIDGIYSYFRNGKILAGTIYKPTGKNKGLNYKIKDKYKLLLFSLGVMYLDFSAYATSRSIKEANEKHI